LQKLLANYGRDDDETWSSITLNKGSVQHLGFLTQHEMDVYKTAFELDQRWIIEHAADRTPFICQSQSVNIFLPANVAKRDLHRIHYQAWKKGVKSLYYCRSLSIQRADNISEKAVRLDELTLPTVATPAAANQANDEECLACQ
jgi:ribonucleoside-diphosphate reductase alpha chain